MSACTNMNNTRRNAGFFVSKKGLPGNVIPFDKKERDLRKLMHNVTRKAFEKAISIIQNNEKRDKDE